MQKTKSKLKGSLSFWWTYSRTSYFDYMKFATLVVAGTIDMDKICQCKGPACKGLI